MLLISDPTVQFNSFFISLQKLQNGTFQDKIEIICKVLQEGKPSGEYVHIEKVIAFFNCSMPQHEEMKHETIIDQHLKHLLLVGNQDEI